MHYQLFTLNEYTFKPKCFVATNKANKHEIHYTTGTFGYVTARNHETIYNFKSDIQQ